MKYYRKPLRKQIFKQYSAPWGSLPYPERPSTVASAGCGCCSITHCAIERDQYMDYTPSNVQPFMKRYAERGHGTLWSGIDEGLRHYGFLDVKRIDNMPDMFKEMSKGNRIGIFLFNKNVAPNGTQWTSGGHYVAAVGFKVSNSGKLHYFFTKDSGGRMHDGWYSYEKSMKGCVRMMWIARVPAETIDLPERGYFERGDKSPEIEKIQAYLKKNGLYKGKVGGRIGKRTEKAIKAWQREHGLDPDGKFGPEALRIYNKYA